MLYAEPQRNIDLKNCFFYHTIDLPGVGTIKGHWDLREIASEYLGGVDLAGQRVLEIGPASGFLTSWMERQGAEVVSVEQPESDVWDFVPYHLDDEEKWSSVISAKRRNNEMLKNSFWYTHNALGMNSKVHYGRANDLPLELGKFDVSVIAMVLTHMRDPISTIISCARRTTDKLVIVERLHVVKEAQEKPILQLIPDSTNMRYDSWWYFSREFFSQLLTLMGFRDISFNNVYCDVNGKQYPVTTIVAKK